MGAGRGPGTCPNFSIDVLSKRSQKPISVCVASLYTVAVSPIAATVSSDAPCYDPAQLRTAQLVLDSSQSTIVISWREGCTFLSVFQQIRASASKHSPLVFERHPSPLVLEGECCGSSPRSLWWTNGCTLEERAQCTMTLCECHFLWEVFMYSPGVIPWCHFLFYFLCNWRAATDLHPFPLLRPCCSFLSCQDNSPKCQHRLALNG